MVRIRPGHVEQHVRHQRALPAGVELLEEARQLADDALLQLAAALLAASPVAAAASSVFQGTSVTVGEEPVPDGRWKMLLDFNFQ